MFNKPILSHPEVPELMHGGVMHEGDISMVLGLPGMPTEAEDVMTSRDVRLAESTQGRLHLLHISSRQSVEILRRAKERKVPITAGITPNSFTFTDDVLRAFDAQFKINPPFRSQGHIDACIAGLRDGIVDVISSGHSPRASEKKLQELDLAPFGLSSLETTLALTSTFLVQPGHLTWSQVIEKLSLNPAKVLGIDKGTLQIGQDADITLIDPTARWQVDVKKFISKSSNTPFAGVPLVGRAVQTIVCGELK